MAEAAANTEAAVPANTEVAVEAKTATPAANPEATETIKVNGKEIKVTKAQLLAYAQKGMFADQRIKSADVLKTKTEALINAIKTPDGLLSVLKDPALGASPKEVFKKLMASDIIDDELKEEMSKWVYNNVVQQAKKTPEQIEQEKKLNDYERLKKAEQDRTAKDLSDKQQAQVQQVYQAVRAEVTKQITADKTFPQTEGSIRAVVEKLRVMNKQGAPVTTENIAKALNLVKKDHLMHQQALFDAEGDAEALIERIGEARALKISKALVARLQAKTKAAAKEEKAQEKSVREKVTDRIDKKLGRTSGGYSILDI